MTKGYISHGALTAVTLLTTPKTVIVVGSRAVNGDARSNASLKFSSGTWMDRKYFTPLRKTSSCVACSLMSSRFSNNFATFWPSNMEISTCFFTSSTASRNAALQRSSENDAFAEVFGRSVVGTSSCEPIPGVASWSRSVSTVRLVSFVCSEAGSTACVLRSPPIGLSYSQCAFQTRLKRTNVIAGAASALVL